MAWLVSTNSAAAGSLQIGLDGAGNFKAVVNDGTGNGNGTSLGTASATTQTPNHLNVTDTGGLFSFSVNGVNVTPGSGLTPANAFSGFVGMHLAVDPGGAVAYQGYASDYSITDNTPESASLGLLAIGGMGLLARRRGA